MTSALLCWGSGGVLSVDMVIPITFPEGWWEGGHDLCPSLLGSGGVWTWSSSFHFQKEGGKVAMTSALLF